MGPVQEDLCARGTAAQDQCRAHRREVSRLHPSRAAIQQVDRQRVAHALGPVALLAQLVDVLAQRHAFHDQLARLLDPHTGIRGHADGPAVDPHLDPGGHRAEDHRPRVGHQLQAENRFLPGGHRDLLLERIVAGALRAQLVPAGRQRDAAVGRQHHLLAVDRKPRVGRFQLDDDVSHRCRLDLAEADHRFFRGQARRGLVTRAQLEDLPVIRLGRIEISESDVRLRAQHERLASLGLGEGRIAQRALQRGQRLLEA